jgi:hypothetical protein
MRRRWSIVVGRRDKHVGTFKNISGPWKDVKTYRCPCWHYKTLHARSAFEICPVCFWEDDGQDDHDATVVRGGPNGVLSLDDARKAFTLRGVSDLKLLKNVRAPLADEQ